MGFHFINVRFTTDRFGALILAIIIVFILFNELVKILQRNIKNRKTTDSLARNLLIVFLGVACFFLLKYTFGW